MPLTRPFDSLRSLRATLSRRERALKFASGVPHAHTDPSTAFGMTHHDTRAAAGLASLVLGVSP